jgi:hypothetical protein
MKSASGVASTIMTTAATITATTVMGRCSVIPTAVMMLSIEKMISRIAI